MLKIHIIFFTVLASLCSIAVPIKAMVRIVSVDIQVQNSNARKETLVLTLSNGQKAIIKDTISLPNGVYRLPDNGLNSYFNLTLPQLEELLSGKSQVISNPYFSVDVILKLQHVGNNVYQIIGSTAPKSVETTLAHLKI